MYIDVTNQANFAKARLISPIQQKTTVSCVHFYYHSYGICTMIIKKLLINKLHFKEKILVN